MSSEVERVAALADVMREKGIRRLRIGDAEIDMGADLRQLLAPIPGLQPTPIPAGASVTPTPEEYESVMLPAEALCRCTHAMIDHDSSGCLVAGCSVETCAQTKV